MKKLDFNPYKSTESFRKNYKLHDISEIIGKNLLAQWGINFNEFGKDKRYENVWEKGEDKPDITITYKGKSALIDWKGKHKSLWILNKRAITAYEKWSELYSLPVIIVFFVFNDSNQLVEKRFAYLKKHNYFESDSLQWDKNKTVEFKSELPEFNKGNLINHLLDYI